MSLKQETLRVCKIGVRKIKAIRRHSLGTNCESCQTYRLSDEISVETEELICSNPGCWLLVTLKEGVIISAKAL